MDIREYVAEHTERGECKCGKCFDRGNAPDPSGHVADMVFFKVAARFTPTVEEFIRLTEGYKGDYVHINPLDGNEHSYLEIGGWIGDQGLALQYMALGSLLGVFQLLTPYTVLQLDEKDPLVMQMAGSGFVSVIKKAST